MKVAIITYHRAENYGSVLQAFALCNYLRQLGVTPEIIDYHTTGQDDLYKLIEKPFSPMGVARNIQYLLYKKALIEKKEKFRSFIKNNLTLSSNSYNENSDMFELNQQYDLFICGSDQIWNPNCADFSTAYLLEFVKDKKRCASYAASIGCDDIPDQYKKEFSLLLCDYEAVSMREREAAKKMSKLINKPISVVPDPVLLLGKSQWDAISSDRLIGDKYVFCYYIGDVKQMRRFADEMRKKTGLSTIVINKNLRDMLYKNQKFYQAGPKDFISLIKNSEYVCTNSFHAVLFSIIYKKNFWVFTDQNSGSAKSRIESILQFVNLSDRILNYNTGFPNDCCVAINYSQVDKKIAELTEAGKWFLKKFTEK